MPPGPQNPQKVNKSKGFSRYSVDFPYFPLFFQGTTGRLQRLLAAPPPLMLLFLLLVVVVLLVAAAGVVAAVECYCF